MGSRSKEKMSHRMKEECGRKYNCSEDRWRYQLVPCDCTLKMGSAVSFVYTKSFYAPHSASHSMSLCLHSSFQLEVTVMYFKYDLYPLLFLYCMGVKLGRSHWGRSVGWGLLRIWCWEEYLALRGAR
jgi:hypothetical protein